MVAKQYNLLFYRRNSVIWCVHSEPFGRRLAANNKREEMQIVGIYQLWFLARARRALILVCVCDTQNVDKNDNKFEMA